MSSNHSGIGIVSSEGFELPSDVLLPLSIQQGRELEVLYYPPPRDRNEQLVFENDFMITPISRKLWPICANLTIRVNHRPGTMHSVAKCLSNNNVSIQLADFSRSGHRYGTWNLVISFDELMNFDLEELRYDPASMVYESTSEKCEDLTKVINEICQDDVFSDPTPNLLDAVECAPNFALAYFHNEIQERLLEPPGAIPPLYLQPLKFTRKESRLTPVSDKFHNLLELLYPGHLKEHRFFVFAEMDLDDKNLRVLLIPEGQHKNHFVNLKLDYFKRSEINTSRGLMAHFLNQLQLREMNVWSSTQNTFNSDGWDEQGRIEILAESPFELGTAEWKTHEIAEQDMREALLTELPPNLNDVTIHNFSMPQIRLRDVSSRITGFDFEFDFFFIHTHHDFDTVLQPIRSELLRQGLTVFFAGEEIREGDEFKNQIKYSLQRSEAAIFFFSYQCIENLDNRDSWIWREVHGAFMQDKKMLPVLFGTEQRQLKEKFDDFTFLTPFKYVNELDAPRLAQRSSELLGVSKP